MDTVIIILNN